MQHAVQISDESTPPLVPYSYSPVECDSGMYLKRSGCPYIPTSGPDVIDEQFREVQWPEGYRFAG